MASADGRALGPIPIMQIPTLGRALGFEHWVCSNCALGRALGARPSSGSHRVIMVRTRNDQLGNSNPPPSAPALWLNQAD